MGVRGQMRGRRGSKRSAVAIRAAVESDHAPRDPLPISRRVLLLVWRPRLGGSLCRVHWRCRGLDRVARSQVGSPSLQQVPPCADGWRRQLGSHTLGDHGPLP